MNRNPTIEKEIEIISSRLGNDGKYLDSFPRDTMHFIGRHKNNFIFVEYGDRIIVKPLNCT
jgi:hypothetical protein